MKLEGRFETNILNNIYNKDGITISRIYYLYIIKYSHSVHDIRLSSLLLLYYNIILLLKKNYIIK